MHSCGEGMQSRKVECTIIITEDGTNGTPIATEENCLDSRKPKVERRCRIQKGSAEWFTAEWSKVGSFGTNKPSFIRLGGHIC